MPRPIDASVDACIRERVGVGVLRPHDLIRGFVISRRVRGRVEQGRGGRSRRVRGRVNRRPADENFDLTGDLVEGRGPVLVPRGAEPAGSSISVARSARISASPGTGSSRPEMLTQPSLSRRAFIPRNAS